MILRDLRVHKDARWQRFTVKNPADHLRYHESLRYGFKARRPFDSGRTQLLTGCRALLEQVVEDHPLIAVVVAENL